METTTKTTIARSRSIVNTTDGGYSGSLGTEKPILNFVIDPELLVRVDDYRYKNRFPTRATAIKWLLEWALKQNPKPKD